MPRISLLEPTLRALDAVARARGRAPVLPAHLAIGMEGEEAAFFYLRRKGYVVVARRWSSGDVPGDVDMIAWQREQLVFVEVKARTARDMTPAESAVDAHKRTTLRRLARRYLWQLDRAEFPQVRFDVISVYLLPGKKPEITHFESAFGMSRRRERD